MTWIQTTRKRFEGNMGYLPVTEKFQTIWDLVSKENVHCVDGKRRFEDRSFER